MPFENALLVWRTVEGQVFPLSEREPAKWIEFVTRQQEPLLRLAGSPLWGPSTKFNRAVGGNGDCHLLVHLFIHRGEYRTFTRVESSRARRGCRRTGWSGSSDSFRNHGAVVAAINYGSQFVWNV